MQKYRVTIPIVGVAECVLKAESPNDAIKFAMTIVKLNSTADTNVKESLFSEYGGIMTIKTIKLVEEVVSGGMFIEAPQAYAEAKLISG